MAQIFDMNHVECSIDATQGDMDVFERDSVGRVLLMNKLLNPTSMSTRRWEPTDGIAETLSEIRTESVLPVDDDWVMMEVDRGTGYERGFRDITAAASYSGSAVLRVWYLRFLRGKYPGRQCWWRQNSTGKTEFADYTPCPVDLDQPIGEKTPTNIGLPPWRLWIRRVGFYGYYKKAAFWDMIRAELQESSLEAEARRFEKEEHERQLRALAEFDKQLSAPEVADVTSEEVVEEPIAEAAPEPPSLPVALVAPIQVLTAAQMMEEYRRTRQKEADRFNAFIRAVAGVSTQYNGAKAIYEQSTEEPDTLPLPDSPSSITEPAGSGALP